MDTFTNDLERSIDILSKENQKCIICGDININGLKIVKDDKASLFCNMMFSNNYIPHITLPTRITDDSISLIDHILLKESNMICNKITADNIYNNIMIIYLTSSLWKCTGKIVTGLEKGQ